MGRSKYDERIIFAQGSSNALLCFSRAWSKLSFVRNFLTFHKNMTLFVNEPLSVETFSLVICHEAIWTANLVLMNYFLWHTLLNSLTFISSDLVHAGSKIKLSSFFLLLSHQFFWSCFLTWWSEPLLMLNRQKLKLHSRRNFCTTRWKVTKRCYDDLIKAYYEGLTVLIKDLGSYPTALPKRLHQKTEREVEASENDSR